MFIFINIIAIATIIITLITLSKYKLVSLVTINGEEVGYVESKEKFEQEIDNYISDLKKTNIAFVDIVNTSNYGLRFINRNVNTNLISFLSNPFFVFNTKGKIIYP